MLNGKRIVVKIGDNLKSISAKINKHLHETGIKAKIVEKDNGYKLHLTSKNKPVQIEDRNVVLANLYNKGHIGKSSKHLIQVTQHWALILSLHLDKIEPFHLYL